MHRLEIIPFLKIRTRMYDGDLYLRGEDLAEAFELGDGARGEFHIAVLTNFSKCTLIDGNFYVTCGALYDILPKANLKAKTRKELKSQFFPCILRCERFCREEALKNTREVMLDFLLTLLRLYLKRNLSLDD